MPEFLEALAAHVIAVWARLSDKTVFLAGFSVASTAALFALDAWALGWDKSSLRRIVVRPSRSARLDIALAAFYFLNITPLLATLFSFGLGAMLPRWVEGRFGVGLFTLLPSTWARALAYLLLFDLLFYWKHRLSHEWRFWWQIHEVHHSPTEMNIITANRIHPFDEALFRIFTCLPLAMAGAPPEIYLYLRAFQVVHVKLTHTMLPWRWGWVGRWLLVSPAVHQIHHSDLPHHRDKNYGNMVPWWDRLFGTWYEPVAGEVWKTDDRPHFNHAPLYADLWNSYARFWKSLFRRET